MTAPSNDYTPPTIDDLGAVADLTMGAGGTSSDGILGNTGPNLQGISVPHVGP